MSTFTDIGAVAGYDSRMPLLRTLAIAAASFIGGAVSASLPRRAPDRDIEAEIELMKNRIDSAISGQVVTDEERADWWAGHSSRPAKVAVPRSITDPRDAAQFALGAHARRHRIPLDGAVDRESPFFDLGWYTAAAREV